MKELDHTGCPAGQIHEEQPDRQPASESGGSRDRSQTLLSRRLLRRLPGPRRRGNSLSRKSSSDSRPDRRPRPGVQDLRLSHDLALESQGKATSPPCCTGACSAASARSTSYMGFFVSIERTVDGTTSSSRRQHAGTTAFDDDCPPRACRHTCKALFDYRVSRRNARGAPSAEDRPPPARFRRSARRNANQHGLLADNDRLGDQWIEVSTRDGNFQLVNRGDRSLAVDTRRESALPVPTVIRTHRSRVIAARACAASTTTTTAVASLALLKILETLFALLRHEHPFVRQGPVVEGGSDLRTRNDRLDRVPLAYPCRPCRC